MTVSVVGVGHWADSGHMLMRLEAGTAVGAWLRQRSSSDSPCGAQSRKQEGCMEFGSIFGKRRKPQPLAPSDDHRQVAADVMTMAVLSWRMRDRLDRRSA